MDIVVWMQHLQLLKSLSLFYYCCPTVRPCAFAVLDPVDHMFYDLTDVLSLSYCSEVAEGAFALFLQLRWVLTKIELLRHFLHDAFIWVLLIHFVAKRGDKLFDGDRTASNYPH